MAKETERSDALGVREKEDARRREAPSAAVVYEAIRREAVTELSRPLAGLGWSALAAGLSMGFSTVAQALLTSYTPDASWQDIISSFGYSIGFLIVILGRQQLFTENTLTPLLELLCQRSLVVLRRTASLWLVVLVFNMLGTAIFALGLANFNVLDVKVDQALMGIANGEYGVPFDTMFVRAIFAGWLVALMLWVLPFAESARVGVIILVTYVIGLAHFPHIVAGSVGAMYAVFMGEHTVLEFFGDFFVPTLLGNIVGGIMLVAAVNYAQVAFSQSSDDQ